jgi:hypothetical protein
MNARKPLDDGLVETIRLVAGPCDGQELGVIPGTPWICVRPPALDLCRIVPADPGDRPSANDLYRPVRYDRSDVRGRDGARLYFCERVRVENWWID